MQRRQLARIVVASLWFVACGGDGEPTTDGALVVQTPDAGIDAGQAGCPADVADLDDPSVGMHVADTVSYAGMLTGDPGLLEPSTEGCLRGATKAEKVHKLTVATRSRVRFTTVGMGTPDLDTVLYVRTACADPATELACNDDAQGLQSTVELGDVAAGTTLFIVVDALAHQQKNLPLPYTLTIQTTPVLEADAACDPKREANTCGYDLVCSIATGDPLCKAALGGPTLDVLGARVGQNGQSLLIHLAGADPDGDIHKLVLIMLDGAGEGIDFNRDGTPDDFSWTAGSEPLVGRITVDTEVLLLGLSSSFLAPIQGVRGRLVDTAEVASEALEAPVLMPTLVGIGDMCGEAVGECRGELACDATTMTCATLAVTTAACAAADAAAPIGAGMHTVTMDHGAADQLQGSCWYSVGLGEKVLRFEVAAPKHVRFAAHTDVAPSPAARDMMLDTYLYLRSVCDDPATEIACNDDIETPSSPQYQFASGLVVSDLAPGTYYLVVDGSSEGGAFVASGEIGLAIETTSLKDPDEACVPGMDLCVTGFLCSDPAGGMAGACASIESLVADRCAAAAQLVPGVATTGEVRQTGASLVDGSCRYFPDHYPEQLHLLTLAQRAEVTLSTAGMETGFDTVVYVLDACAADAKELACAEDIDGETNWRSELVTTLDAGTYAVVVDMSSPFLPDASDTMASDPAFYSLMTTVKPIRAMGESCDPTGMVDRCDEGDTCSSEGTCVASAM